MRLGDKRASIEAAIGKVSDGATIMVGGFGVPGTPFNLIAELVRQGQKGLTLIKNDANEQGMGIDHLLASGQVDRLVTTHLGLNANAIAMMNSGDVEVEFCAQGILAERIRCGGAGLKGFVTDIAIDTDLAHGKQVVAMDGANYLIETALRADIALVHAECADVFGNLCFTKTARNFNPLMAMAADCVVAQSNQCVAVGGIDADAVHTPGAFVDHVVPISLLHEEYAVVRR